MSGKLHTHDESAGIEMPKPTAAPLVLALGITLLALGMATSLIFVLVGGILLAFGLGSWIAELRPGHGHEHEPLVEPALRPRPVVTAAGAVERMRAGMPGYRLRLPEKMHPISAGIKGGMVGGIIMPLPAMLYGLLSGHGIWLPINLLSGMVLPGVGDMSLVDLEQFQPGLFALGLVIHVTVSLIMGLLYGVLMPALPSIPRPLSWGALLMPLLWTAASFVALGAVNPGVRERIEWPWFVVSQLIFGVVAAAVYMRFRQQNRVRAGLLAGVVGGLLMPVPALLWGFFSGHGIWYPVNLLAAVAVEQVGQMPLTELKQFHSDWLIAAIVAHAVFSLTFGLAFALVLPRMPVIPAPMAWGGLVMPLLWTASSYGLMGVVNPILQELVDWPWFIVSQFVFGIVAAIVVVRSEEVYITPAGPGPERREMLDSGS